jgi:hypothetical protein
MDNERRKSHDTTSSSLDLTLSLDDSHDCGSVETERQHQQRQPQLHHDSMQIGAAGEECEFHPEVLMKEDSAGGVAPRSACAHLKRLQWILLLGLAMASLLLFVSVTIVAAPTLLRGQQPPTAAAAAAAQDPDDADYHVEIEKMHQEANVTDIPTFIMEPINEERHARHLAGLNCGALTSSTGGGGGGSLERKCSFQGVMRFTDAMALYRTFCPQWPASRTCARSGMPTVKLTCNGHISTLFGGVRLPSAPPVLDKDPQNKDYALFPAADKGYFSIQDVAQGDGSSCAHVFEGGMYCYVEQPQTCFVWAALQPGPCPGGVSLCG